MTKNINWEFIASLEGKGVNEGYVPSENSGVTVATGFDLGTKTSEYLENMGISSETIDLLSSFMGVTGAEAEEIAPNLVLNDEQVKEIDTASHNWYANQVTF